MGQNQGRIPAWGKYAIGILALHAAGLAGLISAAPAAPELWSIALLAYTLGLRHAFDADHIAAIDGTVRKLTEERQDSHGVGFYFSLGHSSVVFLMVLLAVVAAQWAEAKMPGLRSAGEWIGASVSSLFLLLIGTVNAVVFSRNVRAYRAVRRGLQSAEDGQASGPQGWIAAWSKPLFRLIRRSRHVYPLGFLFGLGLDTAAEVVILAYSVQAREGVPIVGLLSLPLLFTAGMCLMDTADSVLMTRAYGWASQDPLRRSAYQVTVTGIASAAALLIGGTGALRLLAERLQPEGFWAMFGSLDFGYAGYGLAALFGLVWAAAFMLLRRRTRSSDAEVDMDAGV